MSPPPLVVLPTGDDRLSFDAILSGSGNVKSGGSGYLKSGGSAILKSHGSARLKFCTGFERRFTLCLFKVVKTFFLEQPTTLATSLSDKPNSPRNFKLRGPTEQAGLYRPRPSKN